MFGQTLFSSLFDNLPTVRSVKIVSRSVKSRELNNLDCNFFELNQVNSIGHG